MERLSPRKLLAVSWAMPPRLTPQALQVSRLLAALGEEGWQSTVLCAPAASVSTETFPVGAELAYRFFQAYDLVPVQDSIVINTLKRWLGRMPNAWEHAVTHKACRLLSCGTIDALATFAQPFKDHVIGLRIHRRFPQLPWIAHFSDPWVDNPYDDHITKDDQNYERMTIEQAHAVIFTTQRTRDLIMGKYPEAWYKRTHVLPHSFDALPLSAGQSSATESGLHLLHTGNLYEVRIPFGLLFALANLRKQGVEDIHLHWLGHVQPLFQKMSRALGLARQMHYGGSVAPRACMDACRRADVLLSCDAPAENSVFLPSKLVDYLPARRPLLCITPEKSSSNDFLEHVGGISVAPQDVAGMERLLLKLREKKRTGVLSSLIPEAEAAEAYAPQANARRFAAILAACCHQGDSRGACRLHQ